MVPDDYFVSRFIRGLKPHLKPFVKALNPLTLDEAVRFSKLHEDAGEAVRQSQRSFSNKPPLLASPRTRSGSNSLQSSHFSTPKSVGSSVSSTASSGTSGVRSIHQSFQPTRMISAAERADKIAKGLCYFCDHPYKRGHKCPTKKSQLFLVEVPAGTDEEEQLQEEEGSSTANNQLLGFEMIET